LKDVAKEAAISYLKAMQKSPLLASIFVTGLTAAALLFLNTANALNMVRGKADVAAVGWPASIVYLSSSPTIPVPGLSWIALVIDTVFGVGVVSGVWCSCRAWIPSTLRFSSRALLVVVAIFATWFGVLTYETNNNAFQMLFEVARLWVFLTIAVAWLTLLRSRQASVTEQSVKPP
jgi:hypothetical protein